MCFGLLRRQQCDPAELGNKPSEVQFLNRRHFSGGGRVMGWLGGMGGMGRMDESDGVQFDLRAVGLSL